MVQDWVESSRLLGFAAKVREAEGSSYARGSRHCSRCLTFEGRNFHVNDGFVCVGVVLFGVVLVEGLVLFCSRFRGG